MTAKNLFKKKYFYFNILLALLCFLFIVFITLKWLNAYTRHGETVLLPDFIGKQLDSLILYADTYDMRYVVMDSVFDDLKPKGSIVLQDPLPNSNIKVGRTIYVSIVSQQPEMSIMPNLENLSVRQGVNILINNDLNVKELVFQEGFDRNAIQKVMLEEEDIEEGTKLLKNSALTLYVSEGKHIYPEIVPDLKGLPEKEARITIFSSSFNIGKVEYDNYLPDTQYYVYYQYPLKNTILPLGEKINIRLTTNKKEVEILYEEALILYDSSYYNNMEDSLMQDVELIEIDEDL